MCRNRRGSIACRQCPEARMRPEIAGGGIRSRATRRIDRGNSRKGGRDVVRPGVPIEHTDSTRATG
jgi:hypothetical protein